MTDSSLPNLAEELASARDVACVAEGLHQHLARAGREYNLGLPASFDLAWEDTPVPHQLTLVHAAGYALAHVAEHLAESPVDAAQSLTTEQRQRISCLGVAAQALPPTKGVLGATVAPRYLDLLVVAEWLVVGGDPLTTHDDDEDEDDEEPQDGVEVTSDSGTSWHLTPEPETHRGQSSPLVMNETRTGDDQE